MRDRKVIDAVKEEVWRTLWKLGEGNENQNILQENIFLYIIIYFNVYYTCIYMQ